MKKILLLTIICLLSFPSVSKAETKSSISIFSSGGNNSVKVNTTYNGKTAEDVNLTSSSTINYQSKSVDGVKTETKLTQNQPDTTEEIARLQALLEKLQLILKLYEQLLAEKI